MDLETLLWSLFIGLAWLAAIRGPGADAGTINEQDDEDLRQWYAADQRNQTDRTG